VPENKTSRGTVCPKSRDGSHCMGKGFFAKYYGDELEGDGRGITEESVRQNIPLGCLSKRIIVLT
jgi:hypothetical protein